MKRLTMTGLLTLISINSIAGNLYPGVYNRQEDIVRILTGGYDNLINRNCAQNLLNETINRANLAVGNKIIALEVQSKAENGVAFFYIWPEFDHHLIGSTASKCYINKL